MGNKRRKAKSKLPRALPDARNLVVKRSETENESGRQKVFLTVTNTYTLPRHWAGPQMKFIFSWKQKGEKSRNVSPIHLMT